MEISVRRAGDDDLDRVETLYNELNDYLAVHDNGPRWRREVYPLRSHAEEGLASKSLYVAESGGRLAGSVILLQEQGEVYRQVRWQTDFDVPVAVVHILAVHPDFFGQGVGKALLDFAAGWGRRHGKKAIRLDTYEENFPAIRLYEKCGFKRMGRIDLGLEEIYGLKWYYVFEKLIV